MQKKQKQNKTNKRDLKKAKWKLFIDINIGFINLQPKRTNRICLHAIPR